MKTLNHARPDDVVEKPCHKSEVCKTCEFEKGYSGSKCPAHTPAARPGWEEEFDRQLAITFKDQELHPAQYGQLIKWIREFRAQAIASARKEELRQAINELREYHKQFPDADFNDLTGYLAGMIGRPSN